MLLIAVTHINPSVRLDDLKCSPFELPNLADTRTCGLVRLTQLKMIPPPKKHAKFMSTRSKELQNSSLNQKAE